MRDWYFSSFFFGLGHCLFHWCYYCVEHKFSRRPFFSPSLFQRVDVDISCYSMTAWQWIYVFVLFIWYAFAFLWIDNRKHTHTTHRQQYAICLLVLWSLSGAEIHNKVYNETRNSNQQPNENLVSIMCAVCCVSTTTNRHIDCKTLNIKEIGDRLWAQCCHSNICKWNIFCTISMFYKSRFQCLLNAISLTVGVITNAKSDTINVHRHRICFNYLARHFARTHTTQKKQQDEANDVL